MSKRTDLEDLARERQERVRWERLDAERRRQKSQSQPVIPVQPDDTDIDLDAIADLP